MIRDEASGEEASHEVSETATAGELLQEACRLFGREELDSALEVDGAVVCTGVVGGVSGGEASVGSLGVHSDSRLVLCRSRDRVLAVVAKWHEDWEGDRLSLPVWAWSDEVVALAAVTFNSKACKLVNNYLRTSDSFLRAAVKRNGLVLEYGSAECRADKDVVATAVAQDAFSLRHAADDLKADKDIVMAAVKQKGLSLQYASACLRADAHVVMVALDNNGDSLEYASESLKADVDVAMTAVTQNGCALTHASDSIKADKDVVRAAVAQNALSLQYAHENLRIDKPEPAHRSRQASSARLHQPAVAPR